MIFERYEFIVSLNCRRSTYHSKFFNKLLKVEIYIHESTQIISVQFNELSQSEPIYVPITQIKKSIQNFSSGMFPMIPHSTKVIPVPAFIAIDQLGLIYEL